MVRAVADLSHLSQDNGLVNKALVAGPSADLYRRWGTVLKSTF
jgi:hypothetical protein